MPHITREGIDQRPLFRRFPVRQDLAFRGRFGPVSERSDEIKGNTDDMTINTALNHGMLLFRIGRRTEAVKFLREQLPIAHRACGPNHISTLKLRAVLSSALYDHDGASREDVSEAATTLNDVLRRATRTLGDSHPFTRRVKIEQRDANARAASFAPA